MTDMTPRPPQPAETLHEASDAESLPVLDVRGLGVTYGSGPGAVEAVRELSFSVQGGEFVCIVGPSGCGKTTLLKSIAGLLVPTRGEAYVAGGKVDGPPKNLALVFQEYNRSLLPWLTVGDNVTFPLAARRMPKREQRARRQVALEKVGLVGFDDKYPWQLSGGMQQRVAIARALAYEPAVLLMDEPFASLDAQSRADLEDLMLTVQRDAGLTVVFVTHDIDEAVYQADRVIVLSHRPTTIRQVLGIDLPKPRDQITTKANPEFVKLRTEVLTLIKSERDRARANQPGIPAKTHEEEGNR
jgi:NitT/TauT family transport system ATP-binding protein